MPVIIDIAEAVKNELNNPGQPGFSQSFTAERHYQPLFELPDMKTLHVTVVPKGTEISSGSRGRNQHDYHTDVAVQKKPSGTDNAEVDALMALVEEIADFFALRRLTSFSEAIWVGTENEPIYSQEHMEQFRQFTSVITLMFRVIR